MIEISNGHITFVPRAAGGRWEYFTRNGEIRRADASAPVMPDGYRVGRWYGPIRPDTIRALLAAAETNPQQSPLEGGQEGGVQVDTTTMDWRYQIALLAADANWTTQSSEDGIEGVLREEGWEEDDREKHEQITRFVSEMNLIKGFAYTRAILSWRWDMTEDEIRTLVLESYASALNPTYEKVEA